MIMVSEEENYRLQDVTGKSCMEILFNSRVQFFFFINFSNMQYDEAAAHQLISVSHACRS